MPIIAALLLILALIHTFSTSLVERLAHRYPRYRNGLHLLAEVELVFAFWSVVLMLCMVYFEGSKASIAYLESRRYTEPAFVFVIMVVAASRPVIYFVQRCLHRLAHTLPGNAWLIEVWLCLALVPLLGSLITEPAAMTIAAVMLARSVFSQPIAERFKYATLGVLLVNISIGGVLTSYAAPPVLMVANVWQWDSLYMLTHFGLRAVAAVLLNASVLCVGLAKFAHLPDTAPEQLDVRAVPWWVSLLHLGFLMAIVLASHHAVIFIAIFLMFVGFTKAYARYQSPLILREAMLVGLFLAGLVILGGQQQWWLQPIVSSLHPEQLFFSVAALTAITDNAALTYLGALIGDLSDQAKYALLAGAVAGGGLTVIANAPNPAGIAIVRKGFEDEVVSAWHLLQMAALPTAVAIILFLI